MDDLTGNGITVAFGDMSRVFLRHVDGTFAIKRADERFADYGISLFQAFWRLDGMYAPAGTGSDSPIVTLKQHS
jgi:HK97 family phage major capsid protein